jgi:hypothetical protein
MPRCIFLIHDNAVQRHSYFISIFNAAFDINLLMMAFICLNFNVLRNYCWNICALCWEVMVQLPGWCLKTSHSLPKHHVNTWCCCCIYSSCCTLCLLSRITGQLRTFEVLSAWGTYPTFSWFDIVCGLGSFASPKDSRLSFSTLATRWQDCTDTEYGLGNYGTMYSSN